MHFDGSSLSVCGDAESLGCVRKAKTVADHRLNKQGGAFEDVDCLFKVMVFMGVAIEDGRNHRDFLHHERVVQRDGTPKHPEFQQCAARAGGIDAGIKGLLGTNGIEGDVVVRSGLWNRTCPESFRSLRLMGVSCHDVDVNTAIDKCGRSEETDRAGADNQCSAASRDMCTIDAVHDDGQWLHECNRTSVHTQGYLEELIAVGEHILRQPAIARHSMERTSCGAARLRTTCSTWLTISAFTGGADCDKSTIRCVATKFVSEDDARKSCLNHVEVTATDAARSDSDEFARTFRNFFLDNGNCSLSGGDSKHVATVVADVCYVVVGAGTLVEVVDDVVLVVGVDDDVVVEELVELVVGSDVVVEVAEMMSCANSVIFVMK